VSQYGARKHLVLPIHGKLTFRIAGFKKLNKLRAYISLA